MYTYYNTRCTYPVAKGLLLALVASRNRLVAQNKKQQDSGSACVGQPLTVAIGKKAVEDKVDRVKRPTTNSSRESMQSVADDEEGNERLTVNHNKRVTHLFLSAR